MQTPPQTIYDDLDKLEQADVENSAQYRQMAQEALADLSVSLSWRQAIAERLNQANRLLGMLKVGNNDSY